MSPSRSSMEKKLEENKSEAMSIEIATVSAVNPYEKRALRKFDIFLLPGIAVLILMAWIDRTNIGNARVFGLEEGLGLTGTQFNDISTLFFPFYIILDVPWVVAVKRYGASRTLGVSMIGWTGATIGMGFTQTYDQAIACRLLLGAFEAGLLPACVFLISTIWDQNSQAKRISVIYIATCFSGAFGGLIAYATQLGGEKHGLEPWRWLFIIEGSVSAGVGLLVWVFLPTSAEKAWFLSADEQEAMRLRAQRHAAYKGEDQKFQWKYFKMALTDPFVIIAAVTLFVHSIAVLGFSIFLPTIISGLGYTSLQANYLTIPVYILAAITIGSVATISDYFRQRVKILVVLTIPGIIGYSMILGSANKAVGYVAMFLCGAGMSSLSVVFLTWTSINVSPEHKRSIAIPFVLTITNCSGLIGSQIYVPRDAPRYIMGNAVSLSSELAALIGISAMFFLLRHRNAIKDKQRAEGATTNGKEGDAALDFRYLL